MLNFLRIETNVNPDADLNAETSWTEQSWMFKTWSKWDKKYMKKWFTNSNNNNDDKDRACILDGELSSSRSSSFSNRANGIMTETRMHVPSGAIPLEEDMLDEEVVSTGGVQIGGNTMGVSM